MPGDGFCPKCGALMYNNECASCGYGRSKKQAEYYSTEERGAFSGSAMGTYESGGQSAPAQTKSNKGIWAIVIVLSVLFILLPIILFAVVFSQVFKAIDRLPEASIGAIEEVIPDYNGEFDFSQDFDFGYDEDYGYDGDYGYQGYVPSPSDEYYTEIVSSTVRGLSYDIAWSDHYMYADDDELMGGFGMTYPVIYGKDADYIEDVNRAIYEKATSYEMETYDAETSVYVDGYVTYMSEEILSVVFDVWGYRGDEQIYELCALNFDMTTGRQLDVEDLIPDFLSMDDYRANCENQNGYVTNYVLDGMTDAEILAAIKSSENGIAFYSPVGVDLGFNYADGWITVTMKYGKY